MATNDYGTSARRAAYWDKLRTARMLQAQYDAEQRARLTRNAVTNDQRRAAQCAAIGADYFGAVLYWHRIGMVLDYLADRAARRTSTEGI